MKKHYILLSSLITGLFVSCAPVHFYQVYKTSNSNLLANNGKSLNYEDQNCIVSYNLWEDNGNIGFNFYNKTDNNIYLHLEECFYIVNGSANDYFRSRTYTKSASTGTSTTSTGSIAKTITGLNYLNLLQSNRIAATQSSGFMLAEGYSVSFNEEKIVCIPSKTSKVISEYSINETVFRFCQLFLYPDKKQINSKTFTKDDSPLTFSNRILYTVGTNDIPVRFENEFYVTEITNYPADQITEYIHEEYCGQKSISSIRVFKDISPDKFYIEYSKGMDEWKH